MRKKAVITKQPLDKTAVDEAVGLNEKQIQERIEKGYVNDVKIGTSKSIPNIIITNTCTFFNFLCLLICIWILTIAEDFQGVKNCTFMVIILLNTVIGIVQEIRAKITMDKMSLLTAPKARVLRCGDEKEIPVNEILIDDIMLLQNGWQVSSDSVITEGGVEVNESLLTGESDAINKSVGDTLLSGSFIVSGRCKARVKNVGADNYIQQLAVEAKKFKRQPSQLLRSINSIMRIVAVILIILIVPAFLNNFNAKLIGIYDHSDGSAGLFTALGHLSQYTSEQIYAAYKASVMPTSAALIGMIPAGLFLLTSVALAVGVVRLSKRKALVQGLYSIETLARVDMLCLDKTGTITDGTMNVKTVVIVDKEYDAESLGNIVFAMENALDDNNQTAIALKAYFNKGLPMGVDFVIPFSSDRKCSAVKFTEGKMYALGAPEYVSPTISIKLANTIRAYQEDGYRCLLLASSTDKTAIKNKQIPTKTSPVAVIVIQDNIKSDAIETIKYFKENDVDVRVISGDDPITVSKVAKRVGINNADKYLSLKGVSDEEIKTMALDYTVFGRVNPAQKKLLVQIFKQSGHTVAMTGDGINDILALKEADCSIAMANGSEATRNVAQLVLMDSNFGSMPKVVGEGRRVVNNIERASSLFLTKTLFTFLLQFIIIFIQVPYPLDPVQVSFISGFMIGLPSFVLALEPNNNRIQGKFLTNVAKRVIPASTAMVLCVMLVVLLGDITHVLNADVAQQSTMVLIIVYLIYLVVLYDNCTPFNTVRKLLFTGTFAVTMTVILVSPYLPKAFNFFDIAKFDSLELYTTPVALMFIGLLFMRCFRALINEIDKWAQAISEKRALVTGLIDGTIEEVEIQGFEEEDEDAAAADAKEEKVSRGFILFKRKRKNKAGEDESATGSPAGTEE